MKEVSPAWELHRWQGFTRFDLMPDGRLMAVIGPQHDILSPLAAYFARRLAGRAWTVVDELRFKAAEFDGKRWVIVPWSKGGESAKLPSDATADLWREYVDNISIPHRHNPKLQKQHIPGRYRKYLTEDVS